MIIKGNKILFYKVIAIASAIILCLVQLVHIRNIYKLEEKVYKDDEKLVIKKEYEEAIINDKVFPGGVNIIDSLVQNNIEKLEFAALHNTPKFNRLSASFCDTLFTALKKANNLDSLLTAINKKNDFRNEILYAIVIGHFAIAIKPNQYYTVYSSNAKGRSIKYEQTPDIGVKIGGTLNVYNPQTLVSSLKVSSTLAHSYRINFALYLDSPDRVSKIIRKTLPQTLLSIFSILAILTIFFLTFSNWVRQKKTSTIQADFINTVTHEFQTPLTTILIANKSIENLMDPKNNLQLKQFNDIIKRQTQRLINLAKEVIEISGEKPIRLILENYRLSELLVEIISDYQMNIDPTVSKVFLKNKIDNDEVMLDKIHFTSIILNLLDNGIKYNRNHVKKIAVSIGQKSTNMITISVKDNGDGINNKVKKKIFAKFYRNPSYDGSYAPGIGLGLYYVKQCLDAHGWNIEVISKEQIGTEFIIYIPTVA